MLDLAPYNWNPESQVNEAMVFVIFRFSPVPGNMSNVTLPLVKLGAVQYAKKYYEQL